jgi:autotransporter-associated beta strand protein
MEGTREPKPTTPRGSQPARRGPATELLVVDSGVPDIAALTAAASRPCHVVSLPEAADGLTALIATVEAFGPAEAVHVVGHGAPGRIRLGATDLTCEEIRRRPTHVAALARALAGAPILLYGCEVAAGESGKAFLDALAIALGAPVRASDAKVGAPALGGGWNLDAGPGAGRPLFDAEHTAGWQHLLAVDVTTTAGDASAGSLQAAAASGQQIVNFSNLGSGATINLTGSPTFTLGSATSLYFTGTTTSLTISGSDIAANSHLYFTVGAGQTLTLNSGFAFNGAGKILLAQGGGTVAFNGSISSSNPLLVTGGTTAEIGTTTSTAKFDVSGNSTVRFTTDASYTSALEIENTATIDTNGHDVALSGAVTDDGTNVLVKTGTGTLTLSGANSASGTMTISQGTLSVAADGNLSAGAVTINGGTLAVTGATTIDNAVSLGASNGSVSLSADATFSGVVSGTGALTKTGTGILTLSGSNTFSGGTTVSAGTVKLSGGSALADGGSVSVSAGATLDINGTTETVGTLSGAGNVSIGAGTLTVAQGADATFSGVLSGTGGLTKTGSGILTLSGSNTFSGTTTISAGTVRLSGGSAIADGATVNVAAGATLDLNGSSETIGALTGSGTVTIGAGSISFSNPGANSFSGTLTGTGTYSVASGVTLKGTGTYSTPVSVLSGATIAPGNSPGTISTGNLTLASGSTAAMEIDGTTAGTGYDQIAVTGTVTINNATLTASFGYTSSYGDSYTLISNDGSDAVTGSFSGLAEGARFIAGTRYYQISYAGGTGNDVTLTDAGSALSSSGGDGGGGSSATATSLQLAGTGNADTLIGGGSDDTISGAGGGDIVYSGNGNDVAYGNQGNDTLLGQADADTLFGGQDADLVYGNQGTDLLYGNLGTDTVYGGQDADTAYGGQGDDVLYGNLGDDRLFGNLDDDAIYGGQGADTLSGSAGNDLLVGGTGADRIAVGTGDGIDIVSGFSTGDGDVIAVAADVNGTGIASAADLLARLTADPNGDAVLDLGSGNTLTLMGVRTTELSAADFLVV